MTASPSHRPPTASWARRVALLAALSALWMAGGCGEASSGANAAHGRADGDRPTPVVVTAPETREFADRIEALGTARANESVVVTARVTETVKSVNFEDGQVVAAGDVLVELTSAEESAQLAEARVNHAEAVRQHQRVAELVLEGTDSQSRLDERMAARDAAAARLAELRARLADRLIRAPFGGVLGLRGVSPGTLVQPGDEITTLDDIDRIKIDFSVPETFFSALRPGLEIRARAAAFPERPFTGIVSAVDTRIDPRTRAVKVRAELPNPEHRLRPGMLLTVELRANPRRSLALPEQAFVPVGERQYVYLVDAEERVRRVEVEIGRREPGVVEVRGGLEGDEVVVVEGADQLRPGGLVRIVTAGSKPGA